MKNPYVIGAKIYLRPLEKEDAPLFTAWFNDPEVRRSLNQYRPMSLHEEEEFLTKITQSEHDLALGIVVNNLERIDGLGRRPALVALTAAVIFGAVHADDLRLAAGTFAIELVLVPLYLRDRNLWPLGVLHGWVGGLFYLWVLNRDLWAENFG